jgi:hypothetical protein
MSKSNKKTPAGPASAHPRPTKIQLVIAALQRPEGADVDELAKATGWQRHSVRGALAGHIKKKLGHKVTNTKVEGRTVYRIEAQDAA